MAEANAEEGAPSLKQGYTRTNIPFILDMIDVTDPDLIRRITTHPDVDRIHGVPQKEKPWWVRVYFPATRFQDRDGEMFVPLTSVKDPRYSKRRQYVVDRVIDGVETQDVEKIARLLHTGALKEELDEAVVNAVNRRFYGQDIPAGVVESAGKTADKLTDAVTSGYFPALHHQNKVLDFIETNPDLLEGCPFADFSHHIGACVHLLARACEYLHAEKDRTKDILDIFTRDDMPMTIETPRIALRDTTIDGVLDKPAKGKWTVFVLQIRSAAAATKDSLFTFGAGVDERQCAFKFAFQKLMRNLQAELARLEEGGVAATEDTPST